MFRLIFLSGLLVLSSCGGGSESDKSNCMGVEIPTTVCESEKEKASGVGSIPHPEPEVKSYADLWADSNVATAKIYERNKNGPLIDVEFHVDNQYLLSNQFFVLKPKEREPLRSYSLKFNYAADSSDFEDTSVYVNANRMHDWLLTVGLKPGNSRIPIDPDRNSADVLGYYDSYYSSLYFGPSDGVYANSKTDADIMFRAVAAYAVDSIFQSQSRATFLLTGGLSAALAALKVDDPCLGRTICQAPDYYCKFGMTCLMNMDNDLAIETWNYSNARQVFEATGAIVWDVKKDGKLEADEMARLVFAAMRHAKRDPTLQDFVESLTEMDLKLYGGIHAPAIAKSVAKHKIPMPEKQSSL